jgi:hypothetical protein
MVEAPEMTRRKTEHRERASWNAQYGHSASLCSFRSVASRDDGARARRLFAPFELSRLNGRVGVLALQPLRSIPCGRAPRVVEGGGRGGGGEEGCAGRSASRIFSSDVAGRRLEAPLPRKLPQRGWSWPAGRSQQGFVGFVDAIAIRRSDVPESIWKKDKIESKLSVKISHTVRTSLRHHQPSAQKQLTSGSSPQVQAAP